MTRSMGLEGREQSDFSISKFAPAFINRADWELGSFLEEDASFVTLNVLVWDADEEDEEDEEETEGAIFTSDSKGVTCTSPSLNNLGWLARFASSGFTFDSAIMVKANDSPTFLPRTVVPNSLNGIPNSRVAHTSQLGLQDEPRGSWETVLLFLASSMECHRWDFEIDDPDAMVFKLFVGTIRWGNRGDPRIFSRDDVWLLLASTTKESTL